jgi:hypothetical protein
MQCHKWRIIVLTKALAVERHPQHNSVIVAHVAVAGFVSTPRAVVGGADETTTPDLVAWYAQKCHISTACTAYPENVSGPVVFLALDSCAI